MFLRLTARIRGPLGPEILVFNFVCMNEFKYPGQLKITGAFYLVSNQSHLKIYSMFDTLFRSTKGMNQKIP